MIDVFNEMVVETYKNKYKENKDVIEVAKKIYDAIDSGNKLYDDEKVGAVIIAITMLEDRKNKERIW